MRVVQFGKFGRLVEDEFDVLEGHRPAAIRIADRYCELSGINPEHVSAFTLQRIRQRADEQAA